MTDRKPHAKRTATALVAAGAVLLGLASSADRAFAYTSDATETLAVLECLRAALESYYAAEGDYPRASGERSLAAALEESGHLAPDGVAAALPGGAGERRAGPARTARSDPDRDGWDRPLVYRFPGSERKYDLYSVGADGVDDGGAAGDDISVWTGLPDGHYEKRGWPQGRRVGATAAVLLLLALSVPARFVPASKLGFVAAIAGAGLLVTAHQFFVPFYMTSQNQLVLALQVLGGAIFGLGAWQIARTYDVRAPALPPQTAPAAAAAGSIDTPPGAS